MIELNGLTFTEITHFPFCMLPDTFFIYKQNVTFIKTRTLFKLKKKKKYDFLNHFLLVTGKYLLICSRQS